MDLYPLNLILAVATASATIFLGFLPTKNIASAFFARETLKASMAWGLIAFICPMRIFHYPLILAFLCLFAWWHFHGSHALNGKVWLILASSLGISIGVLTILAVTPQANPPGLPELSETLLLASIYLGGAVIGLAYACFTLVQNTNSGVTQGLIQRYVKLLLFLVMARAASMVGTWFFSLDFGIEPSPLHLDLEYLPGCLAVIIMPFLAFLARRATSFSSRVQPTRLLIAIIFLSFLTEILAQLFIL